MGATIIEQEAREGQYGMTYSTMVVEHQEHGRLLLVEGFGGMDSVQGGAYRWEHGVACRLQSGDTLESLHAEAWNEGTSRYEAVVAGRDDSRPVLEWSGHAIRAIVASAQGERNVPTEAN